jgi:hypothetical protein
MLKTGCINDPVHQSKFSEQSYYVFGDIYSQDGDSLLTTRENTVTTFSSIDKNNAPFQSSASLSTHIHHLGEIIIKK